MSCAGLKLRSCRREGNKTFVIKIKWPIHVDLCFFAIVSGEGYIGR